MLSIEAKSLENCSKFIMLLIKRESLIFLIIVGVEINGEDLFSRNPNRMKHLKRHFRSHGRHKLNHNSHLTSQRDDVDKPHPFHYKRAHSKHSDIFDLATLGNSNNLLKGFPELSILSNNDVIYDTSTKSNENSKTSDDFSDNYYDHNDNYLDENHHQHRNRHSRSVSTKMKGPLLTSFRKLSAPGRDPEAEENVAKEEPEKSDESHFEEILSTSSNTNAASSSSSPSGPSASISEAIPTNSGVTKIEINLSFGCLFFCE